MDDYDDHVASQISKHKKKGKPNIKMWAGLVIVALVVIAVLLYAFGGSVTNITTAYTAKIGSGGSVLMIEGSRYLFTFSGYSPTIRTAYLRVTKLPAFVNPTVNVTLPQNSSVRVNYGQTYASMEFRLISSNSTSATVQITPLAQALQISPDSEYISTVSYSIISGGQTQSTAPTSGNSTTTAATTTVSSGSGTTSAATTTVATPTTNVTDVEINYALKSDNYYALMVNFSRLYANTTDCTPSLYNTTYGNVNAKLPMGPETYYNISNETPYGLVQKNVSLGDGNYAVDFLALSHDSQFNNTVAVEIDVNASTKTVTTNKIGGTSIFAGTTYSDLQQSYQQSTSIGTACAAMIG